MLDGRNASKRRRMHARFRLLRADRLRPLRLRGGRRDQEAEVRLLPLHRLRRQMPGRARLPAAASMCARKCWSSSSRRCSASSASTTRCWNGCARRCTPATPTNGESTRRRSSGSSAEYERLQDRIDAMYIDKLDGKIGGDFFDKHGRAMARGADPLPARHRAPPGGRAVLHGRGRPDSRTRPQRSDACSNARPAREKRRLLNFVLSNCSWEDGEVVATFRQPFDLLAETTAIAARYKARDGGNLAKNEIWLGDLDSNQDWRSREFAVLPLDDPPVFPNYINEITFAKSSDFCNLDGHLSLLRSSCRMAALASCRWLAKRR